MKSSNYKSLLLLIPFLFAVNTTQAQFLKKLKKHTQEKIEREAERRVERRVDKGIDKVYDETEEEIDGKNKKDKTSKRSKKKTDTKNLPDTYQFDWKFTIKIETKEADMKMHYMLKKDADYMGIVTALDEEDLSHNYTTIIDIKNKAMIMLMDMNGQLIKQVMDMQDTTDDEVDKDDFEIEKTDTKTIIGYSCQGYRVVTKDGTMNMYVAHSAPVSIPNATDYTKDAPKGFTPEMIAEMGGGLMMEMDFKSSKRKKYNAKMTAVLLENFSYTVDASTYKSFGY